MKRPRLVALLVGAVLALEAAASELAPGPEAVAPALASVLAMLPPGTRKGREASLVSSEPGAMREGRVSERIELPRADGAAPDWLEVAYTVDPELDHLVWGVLAREGVSLGHVILMDPDTGEVLSYVSTDPEEFPATRTYPTASLMKVVTAAAALRTSPEATSRGCRYVGSPWRLDAGSLEAPASGGQVDPFWRSVAMSNNQCFGRLAVHAVGEDALLAEVRRVGLLDAPAARHPAGRVDAIEDREDLAQLGTGLSGSFITPLAAARLASLLAGGHLVRPYWIAAVRDSRGDPVAIPAPRAPRPVWPESVTRELRELMVGVTERGTASRAFRDARGEPLLGSIRVSGKTGSLSGTSPAGHYRWFIGVAPAETPLVAIAVLVVNRSPDDPGAAQVAAQTLREVFCPGGICDGTHGRHLRERAEERRAAVRSEPESPPPLPDAGELDEVPRPLEVADLELPRRLRTRQVSGEIVLRIELGPDGKVLDAAVDHSSLPASAFDEFVLAQVRKWRFTPPRRHGRPVSTEARLPIPIDIH